MSRCRADLGLGGLSLVATDRLQHLRAIEQARALLGALQPVLDVAVLEDLGQRPPPVVLADHVLRDAILTRGALEEEREDVLECHAERLYLFAA